MIGIIERSILDRLNAVNTESEGKMAEVINSYKGELSNVETFIKNNSTAVLVSFNREYLEKKEDVETLLTSEFLILVFARRNTRLEASARLEESGVYNIRAKVLKALLGQDFNILTYPMEYLGCETVFNSKYSTYHTAMLELKFKCTYPLDGCAEDTRELADFLRLDTEWGIKEAQSLTHVEYEETADE